MAKTARKRRIMPTTGKTFSKDYQPPPENKAAGWAKKNKGKELAKAILDLVFSGKKGAALKKQAAQYFGIDQRDISVEMMLHFRQAEKAIQKSDTQAYHAIMNRAFGLPKQVTEEIGETKIKVTVIKNAGS